MFIPAVAAFYIVLKNSLENISGDFGTEQEI